MFRSSNPSGGATTIFLPATSTSTQMPSASGIRISPPLPCTTSRLPRCIPLHARHPADQRAVRRHDRTVDQVVMIERTGRKRLQRFRADAKLSASQRFCRIHRIDTGQADNRPPSMKADVLNCQRLGRFALSDVNHRAWSESLLRKIRLWIDDDLPAIAMRSCDAPDKRHFIPGDRHQPSPSALSPRRPGLRA